MQNLELLQEVKKLLNEQTMAKGMSKNKLATYLKVSSATLSNIENEQYNKLSKTMLLKIYRGLAYKKWKIVRTANFNTVQNICDDARVKNSIVAVMGDTGVGKTIGLTAYYKSNPYTYMVTCKISMNAKEFFGAILESMGISFTGTKYKMISRIADELNAQDAPLLIIDEASKLNEKALMLLHDLWDSIDNSSGIVLAGVGYFKTNLVKAVQKNKTGMPEFNSRISQWRFLNKPTKRELRKMCEVNGLEDEEQIKRVSRLDNFRTLNHFIKNAQQ